MDEILKLLKHSWASVQDELRSAAGEAAYASWLAELRPVLMERGVVYVEAKSRMVKDRVQRLFGPLLQAVLSKEIGVAVQVEMQEPHPRVELERLEVSPQRPIVDESNRTAWLVLRNLSSGRDLPGALFFFHGPAGVGKSFLLKSFEGLGSGVRRGRGVAGQLRTFDLLALFKAFQAVHRENRVEGLRQELLAPPMLVIDELHRVGKKERFQAFLVDVLTAREAAATPTVVASRWHPKEIHDLGSELVSMLMSGFVAKIDLPSPVGRLRYLRALEGAPSRNGRAEAIEGLAQQAVGSYPEIRAAWARSRGAGLPRRYLELVDPARVFQRVRDRVCERLGVSHDELLGKGQNRKFSMARKIVALLCVEEGLSRAEVGRFLARRTRAAVSYMTKSLASDMATKPDIRALVEGML